MTGFNFEAEAGKRLVLPTQVLVAMGLPEGGMVRVHTQPDRSLTLKSLGQLAAEYAGDIPALSSLLSLELPNWRQA